VWSFVVLFVSCVYVCVLFLLERNRSKGVDTMAMMLMIRVPLRYPHTSG